MSTYTKQRHIIQHTEIVYFRDGEEIGREEQYDAQLYDTEPVEPMTDDEIEDWGNE